MRLGGGAKGRTIKLSISVYIYIYIYNISITHCFLFHIIFGYTHVSMFPSHQYHKKITLLGEIHFETNGNIL